MQRELLWAGHLQKLLYGKNKGLRQVFSWKQDPLEPGGWEAFATEGHSDGWNLPRSDLEERSCITTLHFKYEGCLEVDVFLWMLRGSY